MKGSLLRGKTIKKVHQIYWSENDGASVPGWVIDAIEFTDGTFLRFSVREGVGEYGVNGIYPAQPAY